MAQINIGIDVLAPQHIDRSYGQIIAGHNIPYTSVAQANAAIYEGFRHKGKTVLIDLGAGQIEYWYKEGVQDIHLVPKIVNFNCCQPYQLILVTDGSYIIDEFSMVDKILVIPTVTFDLEIGESIGDDNIMIAVPMLANQVNTINLDVVAFGGDKEIFFTGIPATTTFLIYHRTLIPSNV